MNHVKQLLQKKDWFAKFLYTTYLNATTRLKWFEILKKLFLAEN